MTYMSSTHYVPLRCFVLFVRTYITLYVNRQRTGRKVKKTITQTTWTGEEFRLGETYQELLLLHADHPFAIRIKWHVLPEASVTPTPRRKLSVFLDPIYIYIHI